MAHRNHSQEPASDAGKPILALLSHDQKLAEIVEVAARSEWSVVNPEMTQIGDLIREPNVRLVIFDDQSVAPSDRGWALTEIRRCVSRAAVIYVAGDHDQENEKQARTRGVLYYTAKPLIPGDVILLLQRLLNMQNGHMQNGNATLRTDKPAGKDRAFIVKRGWK
jgi:DNA-binding NtrC family response regulator